MQQASNVVPPKFWVLGETMAFPGQPVLDQAIMTLQDLSAGNVQYLNSISSALLKWATVFQRVASDVSSRSFLFLQHFVALNFIAVSDVLAEASHGPRAACLENEKFARFGQLCAFNLSLAAVVIRFHGILKIINSFFQRLPEAFAQLTFAHPRSPILLRYSAFTCMLF